MHEPAGLPRGGYVQVEVTKRLDSWRGAYEAAMPAALPEAPSAKHGWNCNPLYNSVNLNKRCVTLDLQTAEGIDVLQAAAAVRRLRGRELLAAGAGQPRPELQEMRRSSLM